MMEKRTKLRTALFSLIFFTTFIITYSARGGNDRFEQAKLYLDEGIRTYNEKLLQDAKEIFIQLANGNPSDYVYPYYVALNYLGLCDLKNFEMTKITSKSKKRSLKEERIALAEKGLIYADKSIELKDDYSESHRIKGTLIPNKISGMFSAMSLGRLAEEEINLALKFDRKNALAHIEIARKYLNKLAIAGGDIGKGITILNKVLKDNPELERGHLNLGIAYEKIGENEKAVNTFERLLDLNPENIEAKYYQDRLVSMK